MIENYKFTIPDIFRWLRFWSLYTYNICFSDFSVWQKFDTMPKRYPKDCLFTYIFLNESFCALIQISIQFISWGANREIVIGVFLFVFSFLFFCVFFFHYLNQCWAIIMSPDRVGIFPSKTCFCCPKWDKLVFPSFSRLKLGKTVQNWENYISSSKFLKCNYHTKIEQDKLGDNLTKSYELIIQILWKDILL